MPQKNLAVSGLDAIITDLVNAEIELWCRVNGCKMAAEFSVTVEAQSFTLTNMGLCMPHAKEFIQPKYLERPCMFAHD